MAKLDQVAEVLLQCISTDPRQFDGIANRDTSMLTGKFDDLQRQVGQSGQHYSFNAPRLKSKPFPSITLVSIEKKGKRPGIPY